MIQLTRLNNQPLLVNCDLIKFLEQSPDTVLTLVSGEKVIVRETPDDVVRKVIAFRQAVLGGIGGEQRHYAAASESPALFAEDPGRKT